jgi:2-keto-4-pentenoate hydratase/2-oxohepta-3-ene-1,7-dioic acid hydratase in catechol pathway
MRLATIIIDEKEQLALCQPDGCTPVAAINRAFDSQWPETMEAMIQTQQLNRFRKWFRGTGRREVGARRDLWLDVRHCIYGPPFRRPPKIWGIGLNYTAHARDLSEQSPTTAPASFMKPFTTIIGPGEAIDIPPLSHKTTAEAELGVIIGNHRPHDLHSGCSGGLPLSGNDAAPRRHHLNRHSGRRPYCAWGYGPVPHHRI